LKVKTSLVLV